MNRTIISCDLGGTKCAAGIVEYNPATRHLSCLKKCAVKIADATSLAELLAHLEQFFDLPLHEADAICIGAAGQYNGESLIYEGVYPYPMNFAELARKQAWPAYAIVHDYTPIVCATFTPYMDQPDNIKRLNAAPLNPLGRRVALGLGTGLGMKDGVLFPDGSFWLGKNEAGHIGIGTPPDADPARLRLHHDLMRFLESDPPVTFEKILSGPGTVRLYEFFYPEREKITPAGVWEKLNDPASQEMMETFAWYLGHFVGTLQLLLMPEGGIWITGGVTLHYLNLFDHPAFAAGIKASPAYLPMRETYPLGILKNQEHAVIGGGYYAANRLLI